MDIFCGFHARGEYQDSALFSSNEDQSTGLISGTFGGIECKAGEQTGERNDILEIEN